MKYFIEQDEASMMNKMLMLQLRQLTRGDGASTCFENIRQLEICETLEEIRSMKINQFRKILKEKIDKTAVEYLTRKQGEGVEKSNTVR